MKLITEDNVEIPVTKCKKPKFSNRSGRSWDIGRVIIDGKKTNVHLDTTRGRYLYFQLIDIDNGKAFGIFPSHNNYFGCQWYKFPMHNYIGDGLGDFNVDPFQTNPVKLKIK